MTVAQLFNARIAKVWPRSAVILFAKPDDLLAHSKLRYFIGFICSLLFEKYNMGHTLELQNRVLIYIELRDDYYIYSCVSLSQNTENTYALIVYFFYLFSSINFLVKKRSCNVLVKARYTQFFIDRTFNLYFGSPLSAKCQLCLLSSGLWICE